MPVANTPLSITPDAFPSSKVDIGQYLQFGFNATGGNPPYNAMLEYSQASGASGNTVSYPISGSPELLEVFPVSSDRLQLGLGGRSVNVTAAASAGVWSFNVIVTDSGGNAVSSSGSPSVTVYAPLKVVTNYNSTGYYYNEPFPAINITYGQSYTFNALTSTGISGGTGDYVFNWTSYYSSLPSSGIGLGSSCYSGSSSCTVTDTANGSTVQGTLAVVIGDTSNGVNQSSAPNVQYYFITANPAPSVSKDWLGRNVTRVDNPRIGILVPSIGQIVYSLGLGSGVVGMSSISMGTLPQYGISVNSSIADLGDYFTIPDFAAGLINADADYVPLDSGAFYSSLTSGISDLVQANMTAVALGGDFATDMGQVERDIMLIANTTGTARKGREVVDGMNEILRNVTSAVAGSRRPTVAMISYYGYGSMYVDGNQSFIGSEISAAGGTDIYNGFYPSPSVESLLAANPDVIIASIFVNDIANTSQTLGSIPGIGSTNAWKDGQVYVLGNLATNITDEPGPLAVYGTEIYAMILHPGAFGLANGTAPRNITSQWVEQNVHPDLFGIAMASAQPAPTGTSGGGGGGAGAIAGPSKPVISRAANGYAVSNISQSDIFIVNFSNVTFTVSDNFVSPASSGVTVNGSEVMALDLGQPEPVGSPSGPYYMELTNVSYSPAGYKAAISIYSNPPATNAAATTTAQTTTSTAPTTTIGFRAAQNSPVQGPAATVQTTAAQQAAQPPSAAAGQGTGKTYIFAIAGTAAAAALLLASVVYLAKFRKRRN